MTRTLAVLRRVQLPVFALQPMLTALHHFRSGKLGQLQSEDLKQRFREPADADEVQQLADAFVQSISDGTHQQRGYSDSMCDLRSVFLTGSQHPTACVQSVETCT